MDELTIGGIAFILPIGAMFATGGPDLVHPNLVLTGIGAGVCIFGAIVFATAKGEQA